MEERMESYKRQKIGRPREKLYFGADRTAVPMMLSAQDSNNLKLSPLQPGWRHVSQVSKENGGDIDN